MFINFFFLCTIDSSQQISDFFNKTVISLLDFHGEKQLKCGSHDDKNTLYFGDWHDN